MTASDKELFDPSVLAILSDLPSCKPFLPVMAPVSRASGTDLAEVAEELRLAFLENSIDGIVIIDIATAGVIYANSAFADMLGYSIEEINKLHVWDWDARYSREELERMFVTQGRPVERFETRHRRKDGRERDVAISIAQVPWQGTKVGFCVVKDISGQKRQERKLKQELARWQLLMERSKDGIVIFDLPAAEIIEVNPAFARMLGYKQEEMVGMHPWDWDVRFSREEIEKMTEAQGKNEENFFETLMRRKDGTICNVEVSSTRMALGEQNIDFCLFRDITARKQADRRLRTREQEFRSLAENASDAIARYDRQLCRLYVNPAMEHLLGRTKKELLGQPLQTEGDVDLEVYQAALEAAFQTGCQQQREVRHPRADGVNGWFQARFEPEFVEDGRVQSVLVVIRDISELVAQRELAQQLAYTDSLTRLPNRALFEKRFQKAADQANISGRPFALLVLDIDHFKDVNDTLGHKSGDELLCQVTDRLSHCLRDLDTFARLGGDEFAILQNHIHSTADATGVATRILNALSQPFFIDRQELFISGSIGIALYPNDSNELNELFTFADSAMYSAKRQGRNNFQFYSEKLTRRAAERLSLGTALRYACGNEELQLRYQPKVRMETGETIGAEALVRWQHPELGLLSPDRFITIAEDTGLIIGIGRWVLHAACQAAVCFNRNRSSSFKVAVNLSYRQFLQHDLVGEVRRVLGATGCPGNWLEFEITESLMIDDNPQVCKTLEALRSLGISIAIDDFGTGYSALNYLTRLPMDVLKIDRSFINGIEADPRKAGLVKAFIAVSKTLDMEVVAEGVETSAQSNLLQQLGCRLGQGYLFGKPTTFTSLLEAIDKEPKVSNGPS